MNCKNCGAQLDGTYCSQCGQNASVGRVTLHSLLQELSDSVFQINTGFFYTARQLSWQPGGSIAAYLQGQRRQHFKPLAYVLMVSTIYLLISDLYGKHTWMGDFLMGFKSYAKASEQQTAIYTSIAWLANNFAYTNLLLLPLFSLASYLAFWSQGRNYFEHIVINSFLTGHQAFIYIGFTLLRTVIDADILELLSICIAVSYNFWAYWQLFERGDRRLNVLRSVLTYLLYLLFCGGLLLLAVLWVKAT